MFHARYECQDEGWICTADWQRFEGVGKEDHVIEPASSGSGQGCKTVGCHKKLSIHGNNLMGKVWNDDN